MIVNLSISLVLALVISLAAYCSRSLDRSGAAAATLLGTLIFGLGGVGWAVLLLAFFLSSSLLSRLFGARRPAVSEKYAKGSRRDAWQVLANGGLAGVFVIFHALAPMQSWPWIGAAAVLAAANADTWATELGVLSPHSPRLISTGRQVEMGTSGGVTATGLVAALGGSAFVALCAALLWRGATGLTLVGVPFNLADLLGAAPVNFSLGQRTQWFAILALAGLAGSLVDSLLGATLQAIYHCPVCDKETERHPLHSCGAPTRRIRGLPWLNNDWVNLCCTLSAALLALAAWAVMH
jgi:uncharacterized protein (TIGR00297 family)